MSFYGFLWRLLPGPVPVKIVLALALFVLVVWLLVSFVFPVWATYMDFNDVTVDG